MDFYRSLLDGISDGVYFVDRNRRITYWSAGAAQLTGYPAAEVAGRRCSDGLLNHVDDTGAELCGTRCPLLATIHDGRPRDCHVRLHHRDGSLRPVWIRAAPIRDSLGRITGAVETFGDDTAARIAEA